MLPLSKHKVFQKNFMGTGSIRIYREAVFCLLKKAFMAKVRKFCYDAGNIAIDN